MMSRFSWDDEMNTITWTQHPIGQGGFHTGHMVDNDGTRFHWVLDCGAKNGRDLEKYLRLWTRRMREPVDWLFVSHFDYDHVSGLDTLMGRCVVRDVMIPYVDDEELVYVLLSEIARDNLDRALVDLIADPATFFLSRGARRVTFLNGGRPRETDAPADPEPSEDPDAPFGEKDERGWATRIDRPRIALTAPVWARMAGAPSPVSVVEDATCAVTITRGSIGLRLKPYRAPISQTSHRQLLAETRAPPGMPIDIFSARPENADRRLRWIASSGLRSPPPNRTPAMSNDLPLNAVELATHLTVAWLGNHNTRVSAEEVPAFLSKMYETVNTLQDSAPTVSDVEETPTVQPAVTMRKSLASPDHLISMIDGKPYKTLRRHLNVNGLTPAEYRQRYNLKADYPMVAPNYSEARRAMAKTIGLGRKPRSGPVEAPTAEDIPAAEAKPAPRRRVKTADA